MSHTQEMLALTAQASTAARFGDAAQVVVVAQAIPESKESPSNPERPPHAFLVLDVDALLADDEFYYMLSNSDQRTRREHIIGQSRHIQPEWEQRVFSHVDETHSIDEGGTLVLERIFRRVCERLRAIGWMDDAARLSQWLEDPDGPIDAILQSSRQTLVTKLSRANVPTWRELASFLNTYRNTGGKVAVVSVYAREVSVALLRSMGLQGTYNTLVTAPAYADVPIAGLFREAASRLQCLPSQCVSIVTQHNHELESRRTGLATYRLYDVKRLRAVLYTPDSN